MHPFDWRTVLFARHAQHVVLIHFPIALCIAAVAFDFIGQWRQQRSLVDAAYYNVLVAAISTVPVIITGLIAWQLQFAGQKLKGILLLHLVMGCAASAMVWLVWWIHFHARRRQATLPRYRLAIECVAVAFAVLTGHLGGFLSGVNVPT